MTQAALRLYKQTIAANGEDSYAIDGTFFAVLDATGDFQISLDHNPLTDFAAGLKVNADLDKNGRRLPFKNLRIKDLSGGANLVQFIVGYGDFEDARLTLSSALDLANSANLATGADVTLGAALADLIAAANTTRREIIISNDTGAEIRVGDSNIGAARGVKVAAGAVIVLATGAAVYGYSAAGGDVSFTEVRD